ncbi:MAG: hypothetical protein K0S53_2749 [Bacteroidetes bacterium]|jgi:hypothetical protein|nr:hypothetical protein [Bacteroidota bacterium]MDF2451562.1 hypothetical protein [Bacteroidota bacterium]
MQEILFYTFLAIYIVFSLIQSTEFYREDVFYSGKIKLVHLLLIWLIPFVYAILLSSLRQKTKGSFDPDKKPKSLGQIAGNRRHISSGGFNNFGDLQ